METAIWEEKIDQWIEEHRQELINDIVDQVRIKSVAEKNSPVKPYGQGCRDALHAMLDLGKRHGFLTENYEDYMGGIDMGGKGETIGFWGHLDVVPEGEDWDFPPYQGVIKNGMIIGRGAQDNKGQTMAVFYVLRCIRDLGIPLRHNLKLFLGTNEEQGMEDMKYYLAHYPAPPFSIIADSNYPVCYGEKGIITEILASEEPLSDSILRLEGGVADNVVPDSALAQLKKTSRVIAAQDALREKFILEDRGDTLILTAKGSAGHTAFPEHSRNAIGILIKGLRESGALSPQDDAVLTLPDMVNTDCYGQTLGIGCEDPDSGKMTCVGSMLSLEEGRPRLTVNIRYPITGDAERILADMAGVCKSHGYHAQPQRVDPAHHFPADHPVVDILTHHFNRIMHQELKPFVLPGGTYARKLPHSISYGMGFSGDLSQYADRSIFRPGHGGAHGPDESTVIELLLKSIKIFVTGLIAIDHLTFQEELK